MRKAISILLGLLSIVAVCLGKPAVMLTIVQDITTHKRTEWHFEGIRELLELFATKTSRLDYVQSVVRLLRARCGCRCAGIRLRDANQRMPYTECVGFSRNFLKLENCLSLETSNCPCTRIFQGRTRASDAQFTTHKGSFFCNRASRLAQQFCNDPTMQAQLACLKAGYNSLAHAPIRYHGQLFGTIHLADPREDQFAPETVSFIESVAPLIGEALHRFEIEESLVESEERFRSMFERHDAAMLLVEPESGTIQDANPAAAAFYGYSRERLRTMKRAQLEVLPPSTAANLRQRARREGRSYISVPHRLFSGEVRSVEIHSSPIQVKGRRLLFSIIHDVTERKLLEKQILDIGETERQRIGQDLHDSLGGMLSGAALLGKVLAKRLAAKAQPEAAVAEEIVRCINRSIGQARTISRGLFPAELSVAGLVSGLKELARETTKRSGVECRLHADPALTVPDASVAAHLFRIVQEAVNNAVRHGKARHIAIRLARIGAEDLLEIRDDGKGLPAHQPKRKGLGLRTMKYRADVIGAQFAVTSGDGGGTVVSCLLPIRGASATQPA